MTEPTLEPAAVNEPDARTPRRALRALPSALPYLLVVVLFAVASVLIDGFTTWSSIRPLLVLASFLGIASIGQTLAILLGGIDLSIPALIGAADVLTIQLLGQGWSFAAVLALLVGVAIVVGAFNGIAAQVMRAHPLIVTLATGSIVGGVVLAISEGHSVGSVPGWLTDFVSPAGHTLGLAVPPIILVWIAISALIVAVQRITPLGKSLYAVGSNPVAAPLALVRPMRVWVIAYVLSALGGIIAGVLLAGFSGGSDPTVGAPYLFLTVAAVVVGGTSLLGGRGGYGRTVAGVLSINLVTTILIAEGYSDVVQQMLLGVLIVVLVAIYGRQAHIRDLV